MPHSARGRATSDLFKGRCAFEAWCRQEEAVLRQQIQLFESGKIGTYERDNGSMVDTTLPTLEHLKAKLNALEGLLLDTKRTKETARQQ